MTSISDVLDLLYSARDHFQSVQAAYRYRYLPGDIDARIASPGSDPPVSIAQVDDNIVSSHQSQSIDVWWRVWWEKPSRWRYEYQHVGYPPMVSIIDGDRWWYRSSLGETMSSDLPGSDEPTKVGRRASPNLTGFEHAVNEAIFLDPSPLLGSHTFETIGQARHLDRDAIRVRATRRRGRTVIVDPTFWQHADAHELLVDRERGILLRYDARAGDIVYAVAEVTSLRFDISLSPDLFAILPGDA